MNAARTVAILVAGALLSAIAVASVPVTIPDEGLERAIRSALNKPTGELLDTELATIVALNVVGERGHLEGLEYCTGLEVFTGFLPWPEDVPHWVAALANRTTLKQIELLAPTVPGFWAVSYPAVDISPLSSLVNLERLYLELTVSSVAPVSQMPKLRYFGAEVGSASLAPLSGHPALAEILLFDCWAAPDQLAALVGVTGLRVLCIGSVSADLDTSALTPLPQVDTLTVLRNLCGQPDAGFVRAFPNLRSLTLGWRNMDYEASFMLSDYSAIGELNNLEFLLCNQTHNITLGFVRGLSNLRSLELWECNSDPGIDLQPVIDSLAAHPRLFDLTLEQVFIGDNACQFQIPELGMMPDVTLWGDNAQYCWWNFASEPECKGGKCNDDQVDLVSVPVAAWPLAGALLVVAIWLVAREKLV